MFAERVGFLYFEFMIVFVFFKRMTVHTHACLCVQEYACLSGQTDGDKSILV